MSAKRFRQLLLCFLDIGAFYISLFFALSIRTGTFVTMETYDSHILPFLFLAGISIIINYIMGLYDGFGVAKSITGVVRLFEAGVITFLTGSLFFYLFSNQFTISPKTILVLTVLFSTALYACTRIVLRLLFQSTHHKQQIAIVGYSEEVAELIPSIEHHVDVHLTHVVSNTPITNVQTVPTIFALDTAAIDTIYITSEAMSDPTTRTYLYQSLLGKKRIAPFSDLYEQVTGKIPMSLCSKEWLITNIDTPSIWYAHVRTLLDYLFGVILLACTIVLSPFIALAIKINSRGPVLFTQKRIGQHGKEFTLYKFRTMYALAPDGSAETDGAVFSKKGDTRITAVGTFLRKTRLDEFPQAINLLKRDISLIGPRPERTEVVATLIAEAPYFPVRTLIKPGITGWAAGKQHYTADTASTIAKLQYDLYYIKHRTLLLDISILLRTVSAMLHFKGQ
jgi:exopolysaccharide biosynthesis polyprenyl glycosylphosphotransferase